MGLAATAALLAAGLHGISNRLEPGKPISGAAHLKKDRPKKQKFPTGFAEGIDRFQKSEAAREAFGEDFVEMFAGTRQAQLREFNKMVTDKELERFLELA